MECDVYGVPVCRLPFRWWDSLHWSHPIRFLILHPSSFIPHPSSLILHPSSFIPHLSSLIFHPSSFIPHPNWQQEPTMKIRKSAASGNDKVEMQMTPMIDIVFQLLAFFVMSFKI